MWLLAVLLCATTPPPLAPAGPGELESLAAALRGSPAWGTEFVQTYTPAGFDEGTKDAGTLVLAPPDKLRFEYRGEGKRVFAVDGSVARSVDQAAGTCDAIHLEDRTWGRLPLAALLDPGAAIASFSVTVDGAVLRLVPREGNPDVASIEISLTASKMADKVTILDASGNRNVFTFTGWKPLKAQPPGLFRPALAGQPPCQPEGS